MLYYALCLSYHSNTEAVLFPCLSSGWTTTMGRILGSRMGDSIECLSRCMNIMAIAMNIMKMMIKIVVMAR